MRIKTLLCNRALVLALQGRQFVVLSLQQMLSSHMQRECLALPVTAPALLWAWCGTPLHSLFFSNALPGLGAKAHDHFVHQVWFLDQLR